MSLDAQSLAARLAIIDGILEGAFFSPLHAHDWLAFRCGQPSLLNLEEEEIKDIFLHAALAAETIYPELAEDFLTQALGEGMELCLAANEELETLYRRALQAAGQDPQAPNPRLEGLAAQVLERALSRGLESDSELRLWLAQGLGLEGVDEDLAPAVLVEVWTRWVGAVSGARHDLRLLERLLLFLALTTEELALYAPVDYHAGHVIAAVCPFCSARVSLRLGQRVERLSDCPHLVYVGTGDEVHLLEILSHFDLGGDFKALLASYYQSPSDLELYSTILNDLYEMLRHQRRLEARPVESQTAPQAFYNLRAYFAAQPSQGTTKY